MTPLSFHAAGSFFGRTVCRIKYKQRLPHGVLESCRTTNTDLRLHLFCITLNTLPPLVSTAIMSTNQNPPLLRINKPAPGVEGYFPLNDPKIGTPDFPKVSGVCQTSGRMPKLTPSPCSQRTWSTRIPSLNSSCPSKSVTQSSRTGSSCHRCACTPPRMDFCQTGIWSIWGSVLRHLRQLLMSS